MSLHSLGWGDALAAAFLEVSSSDVPLEPARVVRQDRALLRVRTAERELLARPSGRLRHEAGSALELPVIGDWVALEAPPTAREAVIHAVFPRRSLLARRSAGEALEGQAIAANVDRVLLCAALDRPLNLRALERALAVAGDSGATPTVLLTKADLAQDAAAAVEAARAVAPGVEVLAVSAQTGALTPLRALLREGETGVLVGASGAGKSTLVNALTAGARLATGEVRDSDRKGRHTTTHRELVALPEGGLLVDGPGVRELGLWLEDGGLQRAFSDVEALAGQCRFRDCTHRQEPGCAVREGLDPDRLASFDKLAKEQAYLERQASPEGQRAQKQREKALNLAGWEHSRNKRRKR